jgi:hypothetical protein
MPIWVTESKISVYMGNDNPYAALWTLIGAKLFSRPDGTVLDRTVQGTSPLIGFNWSNSVNPVLGAQDKCNATMEITAQVRRDLGFEGVVRLEHHITETYKSIVRQPYDRLEELVEIASHVPNMADKQHPSAKHEGGDPATDQTREHPSDILDYFQDRSEIEEAGEIQLPPVEDVSLLATDVRTTYVAVMFDR